MVRLTFVKKTNTWGGGSCFNASVKSSENFFIVFCLVDESHGPEDSLYAVEHGLDIACTVRAPARMAMPHIRETPVNRDDGKAHLLTMHLVRVQITLQTFIGVVRHD
jgi:hypothetical protein